MLEKVTLSVENSADGSDRAASVRKTRITIDDVAREAGVSATTVSRVVNGKYARIGEETVNRVREVVERLHYTPNKLIRALQQGHSDTIAYASFYSGLHRRDEMQQETLIGIYRAARQVGYDVLLPTAREKDSDLPLVTHLLDGRCDGVILETPRNNPALDVLVGQRFPAVVVGGRHAPPGMGNVHGDYADGTRKAMNYLLELGHRRIAHLAGPVRRWDEAQCRLETYLEVLSKAGLPHDRRLILPGWGTETWAVDAAEVEQVLDSWLALDEPPTAVFCASDRLAIALLEALTRRGLRAPDDLSVVGFDDIPSAAHCNPGLTTVRVSADDLTAAAVNMLQTLISTPAEKFDAGIFTKTIPAELVIRQSTGPVARKPDE